MSTPRPPASAQSRNVSVTNIASTKARCAPIARIVPISRTRTSVAINIELLMITNATAKMMKMATNKTAYQLEQLTDQAGCLLPVNHLV